MKERFHLSTRPWVLALGAIVIIAGHITFFNRLRHAGLSLALISGLALLVIAKHLGVVGLYARLRGRSRH